MHSFSSFWFSNPNFGGSEVVMFCWAIENKHEPTAHCCKQRHVSKTWKQITKCMLFSCPFYSMHAHLIIYQTISTLILLNSTIEYYIHFDICFPLKHGQLIFAFKSTHVYWSLEWKFLFILLFLHQNNYHTLCQQPVWKGNLLPKFSILNTLLPSRSLSTTGMEWTISTTWCIEKETVILTSQV